MPLQSYLTESVYKVDLQDSIPAQFRQLILDISDNEGQLDGFLRGSPFAKRLVQNLL